MKKVKSVSIAVCLIVLLIIVNTSYAVQYEIIDLGTLGGSRSWARGINDSGQIVGESYDSSGNGHAFSYFGGTMTDLGTLGGSYSEARGLNNNGQIEGTSYDTSGNAHPLSEFN